MLYHSTNRTVKPFLVGPGLKLKGRPRHKPLLNLELSPLPYSTPLFNVAVSAADHFSVFLFN